MSAEETRRDEHNNEGERNPRPQQRLRIPLHPFDATIRNHVLFRDTLFEEIPLSVLESDDAIENQLNFKFIDLQVLRIITSSQSGANVYQKKEDM